MKIATLLIFLAGLVFGAQGTSTASAAAAKPNVVLIFIDDMGYGDIGPFGSKKNRTPNLDRMAREGMKLTSFYAAPVCSVSRAQVMTGCYGQRVSIPGVFGPGAPHGISSKEHTVAELMRAQGYATMIIGKWHLGDQPVFFPTRHGFDHYFGLPYSNDMMRKAKVNGQSVVPLVRDENVVELLAGDDQDRLTERYTDEAVKFIRGNKDHPFFLYLPHTAVHVPIHPGDKFRDKSSNGRYGDWVEEVDWSVGRVLDLLKELNLGQNTLVMFSSDNGPWLTQGKNGGEAGPLRGGKGSTWEGGMREPTIAWWPGRIAPGTVCDAVAGNIDFLPTFVKLAGGTIPTDNVIDGRDIGPLLFGGAKTSQREAHYYYSNYKLQAVRAGPWKLAVANQREGMGKNQSPIPASMEKPRLYNLDAEIGERTDVAAEHPDVVARLRALAVKMAADLGDGKQGPGVRPPGIVENPVTLYPVDDDGSGKKAAAKKNASPTRTAKPASLDTLKVGDSLSADDAPQIGGSPITISCQVTTKAHNGVIVAQGGASVGYTLYLKNDRLTFAVHPTGGEIGRITAAQSFGESAQVEASLGRDGSLKLVIDGKEVANGKCAGLIRRQPQEAFCVGYDDGRTVDAYDGSARFDGAIRNLRVVTGE